MISGCSVDNGLKMTTIKCLIILKKLMNELIIHESIFFLSHTVKCGIYWNKASPQLSQCAWERSAIDRGHSLNLMDNHAGVTSYKKTPSYVSISQSHLDRFS